MEMPIINLNGDKALTLTEQYANAASAVQKAREVLSESAPHGRNYPLTAYPTNESYMWARTEHNNRMNKLEEIQQELNDLAIYCSEFIK